ncbi:MAG: GAF domain-containing protein [Deltaproteobacteria bacterium]|nr:GAF domain-containing protein [Deltaproteobacteria bacterium]
MANIKAKILHLGHAAESLNTAGSFEDVCRGITDCAEKTFDAEICSLFLKEHGTLALANSRGEPLKLGKRLAEPVANNAEPALAEDLEANEMGGMRTEMAAPLIYDEEVIGVIDAASRNPAAFSNEDLLLLKCFANQAAFAIHATRQSNDQRARIIELKARSERHNLVHQLGHTFHLGQNLKTAMTNVVGVVTTALDYSATGVLLFDPDLDELEVVAARGYGEVEGLRIAASQGATGYSVRHAETVVIPDVTTDPRYVQGIRGGRSEVVVPIICQNEACGVIDVESTILDAFDQEDVHLLHVVAAYASAAIIAAKREQHLNTERAAKARLELEVKLLSSVNRAISSVEDGASLHDKILRLVNEILGWKNAAIWAVEPENGQLVVNRSCGEPGVEVGTRVRIGRGAAGQAARLEKPVVENPVSTEDASFERPEMAVPLHDGPEVARILHVAGSRAPFTSGDLDLLAAFGGQVTGALTARRLKSSTELQIRALDDRTRRLDLLNRVARSLTRRLSIDDLLGKLLRLCTEAFNLSVCAVLLLDNEKPALLRKASVGYDNDAPTVLAIGQGITGHVAATGVPLLVSDVTQDPRYVSGVKGSRSEMAAPLRVFGEIIGVLDAESVEVGAFNEEDLDLFTCFAAQAAVAIHNADLLAKFNQAKEG